MTLLGCPWDGEVPILTPRKEGCRSEPYIRIYYVCPKCGVAKGVTVTDKEESEASKIMSADYEAKKPLRHYQSVYAELAEPRVRAKWNERIAS